MVQVGGVGEVAVPPDEARVEVAVTAVKRSLAACRESVEKRLPYVLQTVGLRGGRGSDEVV